MKQTAYRWLARLIVTALILQGTHGATLAQGGPPQTAPKPNADLETRATAPTIETSEQTVGVEDSTPDEAIRERLSSVLTASGQFQSIELDVREGIVFLAGVAPDAERREWASAVARRTQDVVAVVNDLSLEEPPIWTLDPAVQALYSLWGKAVRLLPLLAIGALILALMLPVARILADLAGRAAAKKLDSAILTTFVQRGTWLAVTLFGVYLALQISGLTRLAATVLGGTSLLGLAFGFAFRDIAENFLSGILLSMQRPFALGDTIEASGQTGVVRAVTSHGTQLIDFDGNVVRLSNTSLYKGVIRNLTSNPKSRESFDIGVGYDSSIEDAQTVLLGVMREHEAVLDDPSPTVLVKELGSSTVNLEAYFWVDAIRFSRARVRSSIMRSALDALSRAGISMPDDGREVLFPAPLSIRLLRGEDGLATETKPARQRTPTGATIATGSSSGGEGSLSSEVDELQQQADASRATEVGGGLLDPSKSHDNPRREPS